MFLNWKYSPSSNGLIKTLSSLLGFCLGAGIFLSVMNFPLKISRFVVVFDYFATVFRILFAVPGSFTTVVVAVD